MHSEDKQLNLDTVIIDSRTPAHDTSGIPFTQEECGVLAARIDAVLRERKRIGEERRRQARQAQLRNVERARERYERTKRFFEEPAA
jgi:hypothetical protein